MKTVESGIINHPTHVDYHRERVRAIIKRLEREGYRELSFRLVKKNDQPYRFEAKLCK